MIHYKSVGEGDPLVIIHGLFGTADNWRTIARQLADSFQVITVDLRNHGRSFWSKDFKYVDAARDVKEVIDHLGLTSVKMMGHSMGGKVAMTFATHFPDAIDELVIVDIAPKAYGRGHDEIFDAVLSLDTAALESRTEADLLLTEKIPMYGVRQFIMKSLKRNPEGGFTWKTNFQVLHESYDHISKAIDISDISCPVLFIRGTKSGYITDQDIIVISEKIPQVQLRDIEGGHWVHAEKPDDLMAEVRDFLKA